MRTRYMLPVVVFGLLHLAACGGQPTPDPAEVAQLVETSVAATVEARTTDTPIPILTDTPIPAPTDTPTPSLTDTPAPAPTPELEDLIPPRQDYTHPYDITEEYDKFTSSTDVSLLDPAPSNVTDKKPGALFAFYTYPENDPEPPYTVNIGFFSSHDSWQYLECHSLEFLLDDETYLNPDTTHDGSVNTGYVTEMVNAELPLRDFLILVNSDKVEGRLCFDEFELHSWQMTALQDFASRMLPD